MKKKICNLCKEKENVLMTTMLVREEVGRGTLEIFPLEPSEELLFKLLKDIFENWWEDIFFGTLIQGAAWEVMAPNPPTKSSILDGYITVNFGAWHFHICVGPTTGVGSEPTPVELSDHRKCSRVELYRQLSRKDQTPNTWGLRLYNGKDEQQMTVFLPSPFLSDEMKPLKTPDWDRLALWDHLRKEYLGLDPDPKDRSGKRFVHG